MTIHRKRITHETIRAIRTPGSPWQRTLPRPIPVTRITRRRDH